MPKQSYVSWLHELTPDQLDWIGRKAGRLSEMINAGIPIPQGFILFPQAFYTFLSQNNLKSKIQSQISSVDPYNPTDLEMAARHIQSVIMNTPVPKAIALAVFQAVAQLGSQSTVAIRGSSSHSAFSTAHQQPKLAISGDAAILDGIRQVWSELLSPLNIQAIFHQSLTEYPFSIIVEQMIQSEIGGEIFTADPSGANKNTMYINAAFGIRDEYIKRYNYPDLYTLDAVNFTIKDKVITPQRKALFVAGHGVTEETVFPPHNSHQKVADPLLIALSHLGKKIQSLYFFPQKIEFAIADGQIYILDTQPIGITDRVFRPSLDAPSGADQLEHICRGLPVNPGLITGPLRFVGRKNQIKEIKSKDIVVLPNTALILRLPLKNIAGLIIGSAASTDIDIIYCKNIGIPSIIGTVKNLKTGTVVTLDATEGYAYLGSRQSSSALESQMTPPVSPGRPRLLATKLFVTLTDPAEIETLEETSFAGIGMIRTEQIIQSLGFTPHDFFHQPGTNGAKELTDRLTDLFSQAKDKPVILRLNDPVPEGGGSLSINRGAVRYHTQSQSLVKELAIIAAAFSRAKPNILKLVIPFVRDKAEIHYFLKIYHQNYSMTERVEILTMIETPAAALCINELMSLPIQGAVVGLNDLTALTLAIDRSDPEADSLNHQSHASVSRLIESVAQSVNHHGKQLFASGEGLTDSYDVLRVCLQSGITRLCVPAKRLATLITQINALELEMTKAGHG